MARIDWIEHRLLNWARWKSRSGGGALGYARVPLGVQTPSTRDAYADVPIPVNDIEAGVTDDAVQRLPSELRATIVEYYTGTGGEQDHLKVLCCAKATLYARIERAHRLLAAHFHSEQQRGAVERQRVEDLQREKRGLV
ncbi:hypothetical protein [Aquincola sp. J276]|uniref:hypothetical protein n=1 Tax=Aquincola sp. J276 TaxID=2898432 RepID=UPI002151593E|nr:hypothetical protein [Aquincola sp. J276]MCR5864665.1 hypothetical protein [Aquincola sp. J276]